MLRTVSVLEGENTTDKPQLTPSERGVFITVLAIRRADNARESRIASERERNAIRRLIN